MTLNQSQPVREILKFPKLNKNYFIRSGQGSSSRYKVRFQGSNYLSYVFSIYGVKCPPCSQDVNSYLQEISFRGTVGGGRQCFVFF